MSKLYKIMCGLERVEVISYDITSTQEINVGDDIMTIIYNYKNQFNPQRIESNTMDRVWCYDNERPIYATYYYICTVDASKIEQYKQLVIDEYRKDLEKQHNALTLALDKFNKHNKNKERNE